ncbi:MAG: efflux RND transporter periplasmic adaptor subunit [Phycisphaerales bacterium]|nr:efflux RND transporter periplasmic adaptor subunit [Phycisphaerales bacterium]
MKKGWVIAALVVVVIVAVGAWSHFQPEATVAVITPTVQTIRAYVEEQAVTELPQDYLVAMPIAGWLQQIELREGDAVTAGQVVAHLEKDDLEDHVHQVEQRIAVLETQIAETSDHRLEENALVETQATVKAIDETVAAAEAKLEASKALRDFTESEAMRLRNLAETTSASDRELRQAEMEYRRARAEYESDKLELAALKTVAAVSYIGPKFITDYIDRKSFTLEQRKKELNETRTQLQIEQRNLARADIQSPVDGVILQRHQTRRQYLAAGTPLLSIGRLDEMEVVADVLTERAVHISPGDTVEVFGQAIVDGPIGGQVVRVYPEGFKKISSLGVEQQRVKVTVKLDERPERLGVGFRVYVRIIYDARADAVTLPRTSLFRGRGGNWNVMLVRDGHTALQPVTIGLVNDDWAEVVDGLSGDASVVARPAREITAGMRVEVERSE